MVLIAELKLRFDRLLNADFREEDLTQLLLGLRDKTYGDPIIKEIGDCVAHQGERTKGAITKRLNLFFLSLGVYIDLMQTQHFDFSNIQSSMPRIAEFNLRNMNPSRIKSDLGVSKDQAKQMLDLALKEIMSSDGRLYFPVSSSTSSREIFRFFLSNITVQSFINDEELWKSFLWVVKKNGLIKDVEEAKLLLFRAALILFVASKLHRCVYLSEDGRFVLLCISSHEGRIHVDASMQISGDQPKNYLTSKATYISFGFFSTKLLADEWCVGKIITGKVPNWFQVYEVKDGPRLARIGSVWAGES